MFGSSHTFVSEVRLEPKRDRKFGARPFAPSLGAGHRRIRVGRKVQLRRHLQILSRATPRHAAPRSKSPRGVSARRLRVRRRSRIDAGGAMAARNRVVSCQWPRRGAATVDDGRSTSENGLGSNPLLHPLRD